MRRSLLFVLTVSASVLVSCSGRSSIPPGPLPNVSGSWEFIAYSSTNPGYSTAIEVSLKEGQVFGSSGYSESGQISASSQQINFIGFVAGATQNTAPAIIFGGNCAEATTNPGNGLAGTVSGVGGSMNFTYTEKGNVFTVTATIDASGQLLDSGTYTEVAAPAGQSNGACNGNVDNTVIDQGTITGMIVPKLTGTYTGKLCQPLDTSCSSSSDTATATLSQSGSTLTVNLLLTGADNTTFTLTGPVNGNAFSVEGTFQGQTVTYYGYYEAIDVKNVPALYLVNATASAVQPSYAGTLTPPAP